MKIAVALAAVLLLAAGGARARAAAFNPDPVFPVGPISGKVSHQIVKLDHVASALAGRRAIVNCWSRIDWTQLQAWRGAHHYRIDPWGVTYPTTHRIQLAPFVCQILGEVLVRSVQQPLYTAAAVTTLAHESAHASGIRAENLAECRAIRTDPRTAQLLGIPKAVAVRLQHIYRGSIYPHGLPEYRTPPCKAGLPGALVPDTQGTSADLRPLRRLVTAAARALPGWQNVGGDVGPLSPCAPAKSRTRELARFSETLLEPHGASARLSGATLRTQKDYATALARYRLLPRCDLALRRLQLRESHSADTVSLGRVPTSITRFSPRVHGIRDVYTHDGKDEDEDTIFIFDPARRTTATLIFIGSYPVGSVSAAVERRATAAALHALLPCG